MTLKYSFEKCVIVACVSVSFFTKEVRPQNYEDMANLQDDILNGYNRNILPLNKQTDNLTVTVGMNLYNILEVDTLQGVLTVTMNLDCIWIDERISWNPSYYGGITNLRFAQGTVWTPPLLLAQPVVFKSMGEPWMPVQYQYNGQAMWRPAGIIKSSCSMNMKYWPFDKQTCDISFVPYGIVEVLLRVSPNAAVTRNFTENGEWFIEDAFLYTRHIYDLQEIVCRILLRRRPIFYIESILLPIFALGILSGFVFLLPSESGERVSFSITILLAMAVNLMVITDSIPKLSNPAPLICTFLITSIGLNSLATIAVILNLGLYHRPLEMQIGHWYLALVMFTRRRNRKIHGTADSDCVDKSKSETTSTELNRNYQKNICMDDNGTKSSVHHTEITWKDVSCAMDKILFALVTVSQILPGIILLILFLLN